MRILFFTSLLIFTISASAGLYKWVDEDGNVHYSQKAPRDKKYKRLKKPPAAPEGSKPLYESVKKKPNNRKALSETARNNKVRAENCNRAKKSLAEFQINRRVREKDGSTRVITDKERETQIARAKNAIENFCN